MLKYKCPESGQTTTKCESLYGKDFFSKIEKFLIDFQVKKNCVQRCKTKLIIIKKKKENKRTASSQDCLDSGKMKERTRFRKLIVSCMEKRSDSHTENASGRKVENRRENLPEK